jgi:hypothetical protein
VQIKKATSEPTRVFAMPIDYQSFQKSVKINKKNFVKISGWEQNGAIVLQNVREPKEFKVEWFTVPVQMEIQL